MQGSVAQETRRRPLGGDPLFVADATMRHCLIGSKVVASGVPWQCGVCGCVCALQWACYAQLCGSIAAGDGGLVTAGVLHACADAWGLQCNNAINAAGHALWLNIGLGHRTAARCLGCSLPGIQLPGWQPQVAGCSSRDGSASAPRTCTPNAGRHAAV